MKLFRATATLLVAATFAATAHGESDATQADEVADVRAARFVAMIEADGAALDRFLSDDLVYTHTTGRSEGKAEFIASLTSGAVSYNTITPSSVLTRMYGDVAVVTGDAAMRVSAGEDDFGFAIRFIEVYRKADGGWQLVSWQSTRLPE